MKLALSESRIFRAHRAILFLKQSGVLLLVYAGGIFLDLADEVKKLRYYRR